MTKPGEFSDATVEVIWERDKGCCVDCGQPQRRERRGEAFGGWSVQHRAARGKGGTSRGSRLRPWLTRAANGVIMCGTGTTGCHGRAETRDRARAFDLGFAVRTGVTLPASAPLRHAVHGWVLLDEEGGWTPVEAPEGLAA